MTTTEERLREVRIDLGRTQKDMSKAFGLGESTWQGYELGNSLPKAETLGQLAEIGYSVDWILTGRGAIKALAYGRQGLSEEEVRFDYQTAKRLLTTVDTEFMGLVVDAVAALYKQENMRLAPIDQGRIAADLYNELMPIVDEAERRGALRYAIEQKRKELRAPAATDTSSKRRA